MNEWYYKHDMGEILMLCIETWAHIKLAKHLYYALYAGHFSKCFIYYYINIFFVYQT